MSNAEGVERRRYARQRVHALAYVELGQDNGGVVLNVSEGGLAVAAATPLTGDALPRIRFRLPGSASWIETGARIAWIADTKREAGVVFLDLLAIDRTRIQLWIVAPDPVAPASPPRRRGPSPPAPAPTPEVSLPPDPKPAATPISIDRGAAAEVPAPLPEVAAPRIAESWLRPEPEPPRRRWLPLLGLIIACVLVSFFVGIVAGRGSWKGLRVKISHLIAPPESNNPPATPSTSPDSEPPNVPASGDSASASHAAASPPTAGVAPGAPPASAVPRPEPPAPAAAPIVPAPPGQTSAPVPSSGAQPAPPRPDQTVAPGSPPQNPSPSSTPSAVAPAAPTSPPVVTTPAAPPPAAPAAAPPSATAARPAAPIGPQGPAAAPGAAPAAPAAAAAVAAPPAAVANPTGSVSVLTDVYPSIRLTAAASASRSGMPLQLGALTSRVEPVYPPEALRRAVQGTVVLHILIGTDGTVTETQVVSGAQALIDAARDAVGRWRYQPTLLGNRRVETEADATIIFRLTTPPASVPAPAPAP